MMNLIDTNKQEQTIEVGASKNNILAIGGTFDDGEGKKAVNLGAMLFNIPNCTFLNGGNYEKLKQFLKTRLQQFAVVYVFSALPEKEQIYQLMHSYCPNLLVVDNVNGNIEEIPSYMKQIHADYLLNTTKQTHGYLTRLITPTGTVLEESENPKELLVSSVQIMMKNTKTHLQKQAKKKVCYSDDILPKMERLHLRQFGDEISVLYRPTHQYMETVKNDENGLSVIRSYLTMSRDEFGELLQSKSVRSTKNLVLSNTTMTSGSLEEWYQRAWKTTTNRIINSLHLTNPVEAPILIR